jgi:hypothetical protein
MGNQISLSGISIKAPGEAKQTRIFKSTNKPYYLIFEIDADLSSVPGSSINVSIENKKHQYTENINYTAGRIASRMKINKGRLFSGDTKVSMSVNVPPRVGVTLMGVGNTLKINKLSVTQQEITPSGTVSTVSKFGETCNEHPFLIFMLMLIIALMAYVFYTNKSVINLPRNPFSRQLASFGRSIRSIKRM